MIKQFVPATLRGISSYRQRLGLKLRRSGHLLNPATLWHMARGCSVDAIVEQFLKRESAIILGVGQGTQVVVDRPDAGHRSMLRIVRAGDQHVVIRVFPAAQKLKAEVHYEAASLLQKHAINAPRIRHFCRDLSRYGAFVLVEDFIKGEARGTTQLDEKSITQVAQQMARLHAIRHDRWGWLGGDRTGLMFPSLIRDIDRYLDAVRDEPFGQDSQKLAEVRAWFVTWQPQFDSVQYFSLTHNDVHRNNGIFTTGCEFFMIDYYTFEWSLPAQDVVRLEYRFLGCDEANVATFLQAYLKHLAPDEQERFHTFYPFYHALYQLRAAAKRTMRRSQGDKKEHGESSWNALLKLVKA